jgi:putative endopeptidase
MRKLILTVSALFAHQASASTLDVPERRTFPVNKKVNACQDFYAYACSKVTSSFKLPDDRSKYVFSFSDSSERILQRKKDYLKDLASKPQSAERSKQLATVYNACMNEPARKSEEKSLVNEVNEGLAKIKTKAAFFDFLAEQRNLGKLSFIQTGRLANQDDSDRNDFYFMAKIMTLPERSYYKNKELMKAFEELTISFHKTLDIDNAEKRAKAILAFETEFADNFPLPAQMRELFVKKSYIDKKKALKEYASFRLAGDFAKVPSSVRVRKITPVTFDWLEKKLQSADLELLKDVYRFHALRPVLDDAYPQFFKKRFAFNHKFLGGPKSRSDRQERCTKWVMSTFPKEIDAELLPKMFPDFPEEQFVDLANRVRSSLIQGMKENKWLSKKGKKGAIEKLKKARLQLVKPRNNKEWYFNPKVTYTSDRYVENLRRLSVAFRERMFSELDEPRDKNRWWMGPLTVNAYYSPSDNKFVMPIGILQYPFYDPKLPIYANLGAVGVVIGHELGHGIDDKGAMYDAEGSLKQWMSDGDLRTFKKSGESFIAQFDKIGHNGKLTLGENIGDWTGLTFAYDAAFPGSKGSVKQKQDFFLQYARLWCSVVRPKLAERLLKTDPHAAGYARVNEQVKHQRGFTEAFGCKKGDKLFLSDSELIKVW